MWKTILSELNVRAVEVCGRHHALSLLHKANKVKVKHTSLCWKFVYLSMWYFCTTQQICGSIKIGVLLHWWTVSQLFVNQNNEVISRNISSWCKVCNGRTKSKKKISDQMKRKAPLTGCSTSEEIFPLQKNGRTYGKALSIKTHHCSPVCNISWTYWCFSWQCGEKGHYKGECPHKPYQDQNAGMINGQNQGN